jgi:hypothetical protein
MLLNKDPLKESDKKYVIEQYKLYVDIFDRVGQRKMDIHKFYSVLITPLLIAPFTIFGFESMPKELKILLLCADFFGFLLCLVWLQELHRLTHLQSTKNKVIDEIEKLLPLLCSEYEWSILNPRKSTYQNLKKYRLWWLPIVCALFFIVSIIIIAIHTFSAT